MFLELPCLVHALTGVRMTQNPNYYNPHNVNHQHLSVHLSELVENTLSDLVNSKCIVIDVTVEVYTLSSKERPKLNGLLEVVSSSAEFELLPIRRHEIVSLSNLIRSTLRRLSSRTSSFSKPTSATAGPRGTAVNQALVLEKVTSLLSVCVDVMSSNAWLNALGAMDLSQMCVQAVWDRDSPLQQIPHFEPGLPILKRKRIRRSCPTLDVTREFVKGEYMSSTPDRATDLSQLRRRYLVVVPKKMVNWWVVVGEQSTRQLLSIKRVTVSKSLNVKLGFTPPKGEHALKLYVICDSYVGADRDINLDSIDVAEGEDSDSDEDSDGSGDEREE
ncbi:Sec63 Brl domain-containing protein [Lactarius deliciosus]|nr:Sec63 Brl domain-containing protein [Lactarius deliciosus]